jgi:hypothetical protein
LRATDVERNRAVFDVGSARVTPRARHGLMRMSIRRTSNRIAELSQRARPLQVDG